MSSLGGTNNPRQWFRTLTSSRAEDRRRVVPFAGVVAFFAIAWPIVPFWAPILGLAMFGVRPLIMHDPIIDGLVLKSLRDWTILGLMHGVAVALLLAHRTARVATAWSRPGLSLICALGAIPSALLAVQLFRPFPGDHIEIPLGWWFFSAIGIGAAVGVGFAITSVSAPRGGQMGTGHFDA